MILYFSATGNTAFVGNELKPLSGEVYRFIQARRDPGLFMYMACTLFFSNVE